MIFAIVCADKDWGIGYNGKLLVNIPEDIKRFKELTIGNTVIMGRATYDSLPIKPLKDRGNFIITHDINSMKYGERNTFPIDMRTAKQMLESHKNKCIKDNVFVIGGGQIYKELLPYCDRVYLTKVYSEYKADTYFPNLDNMQEWGTTSESDIKEYNDIKYQFVIYDRRCNT